MATDSAPFSPTHRLPLAFTILQAVLLVAALVHPVAALLSRRLWLADLVSHFQEPALLISLLACGALIANHRRLAFALSLLILFQLTTLLHESLYNPVPPHPHSSSRLRILLINVLCENYSYDQLTQLIQTERPDVIGFVEFTRDWSTGLVGLDHEYPHRIEYPAGASGLAVWFRRPPSSRGTLSLPVAEGFPFLHVSFPFAGVDRHLWLVHPRSPFSRTGKPGNPEIQALAHIVAATEGSRIVIGDMNTTQGSAHFRDFLSLSGLRDSRLGFGRQPSWPANLPYRIAIDHAFVSNDLSVVSRRLGPDIGSDHLPVILDLAPASLENPTTNASHASISTP